MKLQCLAHTQICAQRAIAEWQTVSNLFLIPNFRRVLYVVCFLLGNSPASEFYMPTFRSTLFHLHRQEGAPTCLWRWNRGFRNVGYNIQTPGNYPKENIQQFQNFSSNLLVARFGERVAIVGGKRVLRCHRRLQSVQRLGFEYRQGQRKFPLLQKVQTGPGAHPARIRWAPGFFAGSEAAGGVKLITDLCLVSRLRTRGAVRPVPLYTLMPWTKTTYRHISQFTNISAACTDRQMQQQLLGTMRLSFSVPAVSTAHRCAHWTAASALTSLPITFTVLTAHEGP